MTKTFYIYSASFPRVATVMRAFEKTYKDSIETMYYGNTPTIELKETGGVKNIFKFIKNQRPGAMSLEDFVKHYFADSRKNPLT